MGDCGPLLPADAISELEAEVGVRLPSAYREFLERCNGGVPTPNTVDVPGAPWTSTDIQEFFGIGHSIASSNLSWNLELARERFPGRPLLPIACDSGGNLFCFRVRGGLTADVVYVELDDADRTPWNIAATFDDFLVAIREFDS
jgi:hypothetical protein